MIFDNSTSCCFTGHRIMSESEKLRTSEEIKRIALTLVKKGVRHFIVGGALGFDTVAAVTVINMRDSGAFTDDDGSKINVFLTVAIPCPEQSARWKCADRVLYNSILRSADETVTISDRYSRECMFIRNRYMVDRSAYCICYVTHRSGGSYYTMKYAESKGLGMINIAPSTEAAL